MLHSAEVRNIVRSIRVYAGWLIEALCPISCRPLLSLAARNEWPCAVTQLYNDGEITMEGESTLDNDGAVLTIIADLSPSATRRGACTHHAMQRHHTIHSNTLVNAMIAMMHNDLLQCGTARQRGGDHHARRVHAGQQRQGLTLIADFVSLPAAMRVVCPEASGPAPSHITGLLARDVTKRDLP